MDSLIELNLKTISYLVNRLVSIEICCEQTVLPLQTLIKGCSFLLQEFIHHMKHLSCREH
jgi:hypothetical protein